MKRTDTGTEAKDTQKLPMLAEGKTQLAVHSMPHTSHRNDQAGSELDIKQFLEIMFLLLLLRVRNRREDVFAHLTGVLSSPRPFHSLSLLSRLLRVMDFTSISSGFSQRSIYFKICNENK